MLGRFLSAPTDNADSIRVVDRTLSKSTDYYLKCTVGLDGETTSDEANEAEALGVQVISRDETKDFIRSWKEVDCIGPVGTDCFDTPDAPTFIKTTATENTALLSITSPHMPADETENIDDSASPPSSVDGLLRPSNPAAPYRNLQPPRGTGSNPESAFVSRQAPPTTASTRREQVSQIETVNVDDDESLSLWIRGGNKGGEHQWNVVEHSN